MRRASCLSRPTGIYNTDRQLSQFTNCGSHSVLPPRPDILPSFITIDSALPVLLTHLPAFTAECVHCRYSPTDNDCPQDTFVSARVYYLLATLLLIFPPLSSSDLAPLYLSVVLLTGGEQRCACQKYFTVQPSIADNRLFASEVAPMRKSSGVSHSRPRISSTIV